MSLVETLGVLAHHGGLVVDRPELRVGIVRAVSRPTGLELELIARRPLDRRSALQRQADIRAGRGGPPAAPRRLLPPHDEGIDLRVGWLGADGRPHWEYAASTSGGSGDHAAGDHGPSLRTLLHLPPLFGRASLLLAWPEIGFPETVLQLPLPDRATVERDTVAIRDAPLLVDPAPGALTHRVGTFPHEFPAVEEGRIVAAPRVLNRGDHAAVVLNRLTAVGDALAIEIHSIAHGEYRGSFDPSEPPGVPGDPGQLRARGPGASLAVLHDADAAWIRPYEASYSGGDGTVDCAAEFAVHRPGGSVLDLLVSWPAAGLPDVHVAIPLGGR